MVKDDIQPVLVNADMGFCVVGYGEAWYSYSLATASGDHHLPAGTNYGQNIQTATTNPQKTTLMT